MTLIYCVGRTYEASMNSVIAINHKDKGKVLHVDEATVNSIVAYTIFPTKVRRILPCQPTK